MLNTCLLMICIKIYLHGRGKNLGKGGKQMRGGRLGGMGRGGFGGGISSGRGGMGINPLVGLAGLGMFGMMMRSPYRNMGNMGNQNRKPNGIRIVAPNGGENWTVGSSQTITWTA